MADLLSYPGPVGVTDKDIHLHPAQPAHTHKRAPWPAVGSGADWHELPGEAACASIPSAMACWWMSEFMVPAPSAAINGHASSRWAEVGMSGKRAPSEASGGRFASLPQSTAPRSPPHPPIA